MGWISTAILLGDRSSWGKYSLDRMHTLMMGG